MAQYDDHRSAATKLVSKNAANPRYAELYDDQTQLGVPRRRGTRATLRIDAVATAL
jgi:hypothetical protein